MTSGQINNVMDGQTAMNKAYSVYATAYLNCLSEAAALSTGVDGAKDACDTMYNSASTINSNGPGYDVKTKYTTVIPTIRTNADYITALIDPSTMINSSYNDMTQLRSGLDLKLQQLYNIDNSIPNLYQSQLDSTVYSGVLWTILATTLIYYVFIKL